MITRRRFLGLTLCALAVPLAEAQINRARVSRPSGSGPSSRVGRVGGATTRGENVTSQTVDPWNRRASSFNFSPASRGPIGSLRLPPVLNPAAYGAFDPASMGFREAPLPSMIDTAIRDSTDRAAYLSGYYGAVSLGVPLIAAPPRPMPLSSTTYFAPDSGSAFNQLFQLRPAPTAPLAPPDFQSASDLLERENAAQIERMEKEGMRLFKEATTPRPDSLESLRILASAVYSLQSVQEMAPERTDAVLLLLQAALMREHVGTAQRLLLAVVSRDPNLFAQPGLRERIRGWYGDETLMSSHAQMYLRFGDDNPAPTSYALQAYAAWLIDDQARVREAVTHLRELNKGGKLEQGADAAGYALLELAQAQAPPPAAP